MPKPFLKEQSEKLLPKAIQQTSSLLALRSKNGQPLSEMPMEVLSVEMVLGSPWFFPGYEGDFVDSGSKSLMCWIQDSIELHLSCISASGGTTVARLPIPARPPRNMHFVVFVGTSPTKCTVQSDGNIVLASGSAGALVAGSLVFTPVSSRDRSFRAGLPILLQPQRIKNPIAILPAEGCSSLAWDKGNGVRITDIQGVKPEIRTKVSFLLIGE